MRERARALRRDLRFLLALRRLPWRVARLKWRAWRLGARIGDEFGRASATRPRKLRTILVLAGDAGYVVELGTAQGWTSISLALARPGREVVTYDPFERPQPRSYLALVPEDVRRRVTLVLGPGESGPRSDRPVDLLYIDSSHEREATVRELEAWRPVLRDGAVVVFDDFAHPDFPGVTEAVSDLALRGEERHGLFVHRVTR